MDGKITLRMVDGKPVVYGDRLWSKYFQRWEIITGISDNDLLVTKRGGAITPTNCSWKDEQPEIVELHTTDKIKDSLPTKLYHATTTKKAKAYRDTGYIRSPVRGFTTEQAAMAWAMKVGRQVILEINVTNPYKLPDYHNKYGQAWWNDGNVTDWHCTFSAIGDA